MSMISTSTGGNFPCGSDRPTAGTKRNASTFLPPLPPSSASKKRLSKQQSDSCVSGLSSTTFSGNLPTGTSCPVLTPTSQASQARSARSCILDVPLPTFLEDNQLQEECSMTEAVCQLPAESAARSPSVTEVTFQSSNCRGEMSCRVNCEEELDDEEDEVKENAQSEGSCGMLLEEYPDQLRISLPEARQTGTLLSPGKPGDRPAVHQSYEQCGPYEEDIFRNLRHHEFSRKPVWGYLESNQKDLLVDHRRIMVNWLIEFAEEFNLEAETLFLCVSILDQFLLRGPPVKKGSLQLLGTACMLIAVKFQETHPPNLIQSCCLAAEGSFTQEQVVAMEALVLKTIGYCCAIPTTQTFLWHHLKEANPETSLQQMSQYLALLSLCEYSLLKYYPSALSAAAVLLAGIFSGRDSAVHHAQMRCEYAFSELKPIMRALVDLHSQTPSHPHLSSIKRKFSDEHRLAAAALSSSMCSLMDRRAAH